MDAHKNIGDVMVWFFGHRLEKIVSTSNLSSGEKTGQIERIGRHVFWSFSLRQVVVEKSGFLVVFAPRGRRRKLLVRDFGFTPTPQS